MRVLVVEDEAQIRDLVTAGLVQHHLTVTGAATVAEALGALDGEGDGFDVVILDPAKMTRDREQIIPALKVA